jgi:signal transduction histidine kinase/ligand-binding sensor domain-containing protein
MERRAGRTQAKAYATLILLACCPRASALNPSLDINQYAHKAWTIRDGFFKGIIYAIAQTPDGYLWLGTEFGLLRFDGVQRVPWQPPAGQHLPNSEVRNLLVARNGRLWIGTLGGLASWKDGKLTHYAELAGRTVQSLLEDREGTIWASAGATRAGELCAIRGGRVRCYGEDGGFGRGVDSLFEDSGGNLWAGSPTGLWRWKPGPPERYPMPETEIRALIEGEDGAPLIAMPGGIRHLVDGKAEAFPLPGVGRPFIANKLLPDRDGGLWVGTADQGLLHVHQGRVDVFAQSDGLSGDLVQRLFEDREGNIWVATLDGLDRFRDLAVPTISVKQGLSNATVFSVLAAMDGSVWLGTVDGLNRWKDGQTTIYRKRSGLPDDAVESLFQDGRGRIWASTRSGFGYLDDGRFIPVSGTAGGAVHGIAGDRAGNLWIGNQVQGLFHLLEGSVVEQIPWARLGRKDYAEAMLHDSSQGGLWLGFYLGGVAYFKDGQVRASHVEADGLGGGYVEGLQLDQDGTLWAATEGGLSRLKDGHVATLTSKNGLPCDSVHWTTEDDDHSFWLYTACGLVRIARPELDAWVTDSKRTIQATVFDSSDGVRSHSYRGGYSPRVAKTADGKIWFLPFDGVSVIDPRHLPFNKLPPPVHIEQIIADRTTHDAASNLRLPALTRDLEIDYTALSLVAPEKNRFKYKLEGYDREWQDVGNRRQAFYTNLGPRNYRFRVIASNNSGVWNETGAALDFSVDPAYYQTPWFRASIAAVILALLWGLYRYRLHQIAREFNVRMEERVGERTRIARDLHDTLLQSFQGLMLHLQVVDDLLPQGRAKVELEKTLDRADQAIAEGRTAVYDLRSSTTTTNDLAQAVREVGNELAAPGAATFRLVVEGPVRDLHPIIRDEVYRIAREALRNAFSHARAHHIEAELIYADRLFRLRIRDDGQGIAPAILEEGRPGHYGLPGMRERAQQIGAKLTIWSGGGSGTEIELRLEGSIAYGTPPGRSRLRLFGKKAG